MSIPHSQWAQKLKPSPTLEVKAVADAMRKAGGDIFDFGIGEMNPEIPLPTNIKEGITKALKEDATHYSPAGGDPELVEAIVEDLGRFQLNYSPEQIVVFPGPKDAIFKAALALLNPTAKRHRLVMLSPGYESFENIPMLLTGKPPILLETDAQFLPNPRKLADLLKADHMIGAVVLNSPNNPTGAVYERPLLEQLAEVIGSHPDVAVLSDEVYRTIYYDGIQHASIASFVPEQAFVVGGMSKEVSGTGLRLGFVAGPQEVMKTLEIIEGNASSCVNLPTQKGYARFLREDSNLQVRHQIREGLCRRRDCLLEHFASAAPDALWHTPKGAFYFFPDMHAYLGCRTADGQLVESDHDLARYLLQTARVVATPGSLFQRPGHLRFAYAVPLETIKGGMAHLGTALAKLTRTQPLQ
jgi:aspartate aminotransferase